MTKMIVKIQGANPLRTDAPIANVARLQVVANELQGLNTWAELIGFLAAGDLTVTIPAAQQMTGAQAAALGNLMNTAGLNYQNLTPITSGIGQAVIEAWRTSPLNVLYAAKGWTHASHPDVRAALNEINVDALGNTAALLAHVGPDNADIGHASALFAAPANGMAAGQYTKAKAQLQTIKTLLDEIPVASIVEVTQLLATTRGRINGAHFTYPLLNTLVGHLTNAQNDIVHIDAIVQRIEAAASMTREGAMNILAAVDDNADMAQYRTLCQRVGPAAAQVSAFLQLLQVDNGSRAGAVTGAGDVLTQMNLLLRGGQNASAEVSNFFTALVTACNTLTQANTVLNLQNYAPHMTLVATEVQRIITVA